jgi:hypothetical protein
VIEVRYSEREFFTFLQFSQRVEQDDRVYSARDGDQDAVSGSKHSVLFDRLFDLVEHRASILPCSAHLRKRVAQDNHDE